MGLSKNFLLLINSFLHNRYQQITLNGHSSDFGGVETVAPQVLILGSYFLLIYTNDLHDYISLKVKLFADNISIFSITYDPKTSAINLNENLKAISEMKILWKMFFNPK